MTGALSFPTHILTFLEWLKKTDGRDKLYRLVAYGSKVPIHILKENGGDKDLIQKLSKGASAVGLSRKLMRMFRSLQFMQDFLQAFGVADQVEKCLSMIKAFALTIWMLVDHAQWFDKDTTFSLISKGVFSAVVKAKDTSNVDRDVAIKLTFGSEQGGYLFRTIIRTQNQIA